MKVSIIGAGYVGLVTGACLADRGHQVVCVDLDSAKVAKINQAISPVYEPGLEELLRGHIGLDLTATTECQRAVHETDISIITVGTPFYGTQIDLSYVKLASHMIGKALRTKSTYHLVVIKSTVVPGTSDQVVRPILEELSGKRAGVEFGIGTNPEFLREGNAIQDFMNPDRIILGGIDDRSTNVLEELYQVFEGVDILRTNNTTAEMIKYASNSLLATMISFSNEIGNLCAAIGSTDVVEVMKGVHLDKRLSPIMPSGERVVPSFTSYLHAGCGFGGSCFPKDVKALIAFGKQAGLPMRLLESVIQVNDQQPQQVVSLLKKHFSSLSDLQIAVLGLAFKPGTDDIRESPAIPIVNALSEHRAQIRLFDPVVSFDTQDLFNDHNIELCTNLDESIRDVEVIVLLAQWPEFLKIPEMLVDLDHQPLVIDGRRMLDKHDVARYVGIGL